MPKGVIAEYPYNNFYIYIVFHKKEGRRFAVLYPADKSSGLKRTTISYARYLMSVNFNSQSNFEHKKIPYIPVVLLEYRKNTSSFLFRSNQFYE